METRSTVNSAVIATYDHNAVENERNRPLLEAALRASGASVAWSRVRNGDFLELLRVRLGDASRSGLRVALDISCMPSVLILAVMKVLSEYSDARLSVLYAEAVKYGPQPEEAEFYAGASNDEISVGVDYGVGSIRYSVDYQGSHVPGLADLVVLVPGFGLDRARAAISYVNPAYLLDPAGHIKWLLGRPRRPEDAWRRDALVRLHSIAEEDVLESVDDVDYRAMIEALDDVYESSRFRANVTVAPFGTKLQSIGVAIYCLMRSALRVLLVEPEYYDPRGYSSGIGDCWQIEFGRMGNLTGLLQSVDRLVVQSAG
ncbi:hypothetical protein [Cellulomonas soli]|uniref:Uncharacterized protein n=1 Tax=Cellulomonas soli TaxID=931535 RepID=A0A512PAY7_9CELL|nr:hypothetical protein [Cellulomonas soli]NYI60756.1 hypothetical protein [Cellulomonas soli]GEP68272.1 hypothetical protein CSO01_09870 [Cellulomonas soli]